MRTITITDSGEIRFDDGTNQFSFQTPTSLAGALSLELPSADGGAGDVLSTNGAGVLSFVAAGSGTISGGGTIGFVPRFDGAASIADGVIQDDGVSRIGIGKAVDPSWTVDVNGNVQAIASTAGAETLRVEQTSNTGLIALFSKTGTTSGTAVEVSNAGTGIGLDINQTGEAVGLTLDKTSGGGTNAAAFACDGTADTLSLTCTGAAGRSLIITHTATSGAVEIDQQAANTALIVGTTGAGIGIDINVPGAATGNAIVIDHAGEGNGIDLNFTSTTAGTYFGIDFSAGAGTEARFLTASQDADADMVDLTKVGSGGGEVISFTNAGTGTGLMGVQNGEGSILNLNKAAAGATDAAVLTNAGTGDGLLIDQDGAGIALNIDSESTTAVIQTQHIAAPTRGTIAFTDTVTTDPSSPSFGDMWFLGSGMDIQMRYRRGTVVEGPISVTFSDHTSANGLFQKMSHSGVSAQLVTISGGTATISRSFIQIAAETGVADNCDNISGPTEAGTIVVFIADTGDTITFRHNAPGNLRLESGTDFALSGNDTFLLLFDGSNYREIVRRNNS